MMIELILLLYFLVRLFHHMYFEEAHVFWKDPKNVTILVITLVGAFPFCTTIIIFIDIYLTLNKFNLHCIQLIGIDMVCYTMWKELAPPDVADKAVRWSRPLRPLYLINFPQGRQVVMSVHMGTKLYNDLKLFEKQECTPPPQVGGIPTTGLRPCSSSWLCRLGRGWGGVWTLQESFLTGLSWPVLPGLTQLKTLPSLVLRTWSVITSHYTQHKLLVTHMHFQIRKAFRNIRRTLPDVLHVLVLFISSIAVFALMATKLFQNR